MKNTTIRELEVIKKILKTKGSKYPVKSTSSLRPLYGYTLSKSGKWWKAVVLIEIKTRAGKKYQLRLYAWQKIKKVNGNFVKSSTYQK